MARTLQISALLALLAAPALASDTTLQAEQATRHQDAAARQERSNLVRARTEQARAGAPAAEGARTALPTLPLFELPEQASDTARQQVSLAHARRDSHRAAHTRAAAAPSAETERGTSSTARNVRQKPAPKQLAAARERLAAARARQDILRGLQLAAAERRLAAAERRADAQERRAAAVQQREASAERRAKAAELQAAARERRVSAGRR